MRTFRDLQLDHFQQQALEGIRTGQSVIVAAPTGCGKTLIAEYAIERAMEEGARVIYTAPIKALSNQKFRDFGVLYGERVGIMTGDVTIQPDAPLLVMTTEIFRNTIFESPERLDGLRYVIFDEIHYLDDPERGTVWEESIIFAPPDIRFVCLSATIANLDQLAAWIRKVRPGRLKVVEESKRPVPLTYGVWNGGELIDPRTHKGPRYPIARATRAAQRGRGARRHLSVPQQNRSLIEEIIRRGHLPCIFFIFSRAFVERTARACLDLEPFLTGKESRALTARWRALAEQFGLDAKDRDTEVMARLVERGIAYHHAGLLPTLKEVVERLFTSGLIKLLFATETFALGVNMPARAVAFESLKKFDGVKLEYMPTRAFLQMAGRAGRRGLDPEGFVYANVFPGEDDPAAVRRVLYGEVEEIGSSFRLSYSTILTLYSRLGEGIFEACEKSFAYFRHKKEKAAYYLDMVSLIRRRLQLLEARGYLDGQKLTPRGRFAARVFGYEIELTELFAGGLIERLEPPALAALLTSIVYESKRDQGQALLPRRVQLPLQRDAEALLDPFRDAELELRLPPIKRLDWGLARVAWEWALGAPWDAIAEMTDLGPGDVIRHLRMTLQLLRQLRKPLSGLDLPQADLDALRKLLAETTACIRRDEVDAERQLRRSIALGADEEAAAAAGAGGEPAERDEDEREAERPRGPGARGAAERAGPDGGAAGGETRERGRVQGGARGKGRGGRGGGGGGRGGGGRRGGAGPGRRGRGEGPGLIVVDGEGDE